MIERVEGRNDQPAARRYAIVVKQRPAAVAAFRVRRNDDQRLCTFRHRQDAVKMPDRIVEWHVTEQFVLRGYELLLRLRTLLQPPPEIRRPR